MTIIYNSHNLTKKEKLSYLINNIKVYYYIIIVQVVYRFLNLLLFNKFTRPKNIYQYFIRSDIYVFLRDLLCFKGLYLPIPKYRYRHPYIFGWVTKDNPTKIEFDDANTIDEIDYDKEISPIDANEMTRKLLSSRIILR